MLSSSTYGTRWLQQIDGLSPTQATLIGGPLGLLIGLVLPKLPSSALTVVVFVALLVAIGRLGSTGQSVLVEFGSAEEAPEWMPDPPPPIALREMWVHIEEGSFLMGSPDDEEGRREVEGPVRQVTISAFQIMKVVVTAELFHRVMGGEKPKPGDEQLPKTRISWFEAVKFCNALSETEGLTACYEFISDGEVRWHRELDGYRLPTEAEWERACRADRQTAYSFGDDAKLLADYAWFGVSVNPVARKSANRFGLFDMHGNVWEWCSDWFGPYLEVENLDPAGPNAGASKILRGGASWGGPRGLRSACRGRGEPDYRGEDVGFRCARGPRRQP